MLAFLGFASSAEAATFTVTTVADSGSGSLRQAMLDAGAAAGDHTITLTLAGTITLASALPALANNTTVQGPGTNLVTISGNGAVRVFTVSAGTTCTVSGLTIANAYAMGYSNGAAIANAGRLTILACALVHNTNAGGWGGAVFNSGSLAITNSIFFENQAIGEAGSGSGGATTGAGGGGAGMGGGLFSLTGTVTLAGCSFLDNSALGGDGGGTNGWRNGNGGGVNGGRGAILVGDNGQPGGFGGGGGGARGDLGMGGGGGSGGTGGFGGGGGGGGQGSRLGGGPGGGAGFSAGAADDGGLLSTGSGGGGAGLGGGIFIYDGTMTIVNCSFVGNQTAGGHGGLGQSGYGADGSGVVGGVFSLDGAVDVHGSGVVVVNPTTPLEMRTYGRVQSLAPVGTPVVFADGGPVLTEATGRGSAQVALQTSFAGGRIVYSLDRTDPRLSSAVYTGPIAVSNSILLRAVAYNSDATAAVELEAFRIVILPVLKASAAGGGSVGIDPPAGPYFSNSIAIIRARPASGWTFLHWLGDASGANPGTTVTMTRDKYVQAVFGTTVGTAVIGGGSILADPALAVYPFGTTIRFTAQPAAGNYLARWDAAFPATNNPLALVVSNASPTVTAVFAALEGSQAALTVIENGAGHVASSPSAVYYSSSQTVTLTALPDAGQDFRGWTGDASGVQNPLVATLNHSQVIQANFTRRPTLSAPAGLTGLTPEGFRLFVTGEIGAAYQILGSTDFTDWLLVGAVTNQFTTVQFTDGTATNPARRFYRATSP